MISTPKVTSYTVSTGLSSCQTNGTSDQLFACFSDVYCRIYISVVESAAIRTTPFSDAQFFCCRIFITATMTFLTAWLKSVNFYKSFAEPFQIRYRLPIFQILTLYSFIAYSNLLHLYNHILQPNYKTIYAKNLFAYSLSFREFLTVFCEIFHGFYCLLLYAKIDA